MVRRLAGALRDAILGKVVGIRLYRLNFRQRLPFQFTKPLKEVHRHREEHR